MRRRLTISVLALIALTLVPTAVTRVRTEHQDLFHERARTRQINRLQGVIARLGGPSAILACGTPSSQLEYQSILAWNTGLNVGQVAFHPSRDLRRHRRIVLFVPVGHGWRVQPHNTPPALRAQCRHLRTRTAIS